MRNESEFLHAAMHSYDNTQCYSMEEFNSDLFRITVIKRMIMRYLDGEELQVRVILNNLVVLYNCFGDCTNSLIFYKIEPVYFPQLIPFIEKLNRFKDYSGDRDPKVVHLLENL